MNVTYRQIASYLVSSMPSYSHTEFSSLVDDSAKAIESLPSEAKVALQAAYIFSHTRQVQMTERGDVFQALFMAVYKARTRSPALAYTIARYDWKNWIAKRCWRQRILSGHVIRLEQAEDEEVASVSCDFEAAISSKVITSKVLESLPDKIKAIVNKRLYREPLSNTERQRLSRYLRKNGTKIRAMLTA